MNAHINPHAIAAALVRTGIIPHCTACNRVHDADAQCADIAASERHAQAVAAADADLFDRAQDLLAAHRDALFHSRAVLNFRVRRKLDDVLASVCRALEDMRIETAIDHDLWDGIDPADMLVMTVDALIVDFRIGGAK